MSNDTNADVVERLDLLLGVVQLAFSEQIEEARGRARADEIVVAILDRCQEWAPAGEMVEEVATLTGAAKRTVQRRVADLVTKRALSVEGSGRAARYRSTGLL